MRIASIDIGTNTILLLICEIDAQGQLTELHHAERVPRIGRDVDRKGNLAQSAFDRARDILLEYAGIAREHHAEILTACATSAVRDAGNGKDFARRVGSAAGIPIRILSGDEEALYTYRGAIQHLAGSGRDAGMVDIGGGSTELVFPEIQGKLRRTSLQTGSVRITERHFGTVPPFHDALRSATEEIDSLLRRNMLPGNAPEKLIGVAGTVTTLACLDQGLQEFDAGKVEGFMLARDSVKKWFERLSKMTAGETGNLSAVVRGREDILAAGTLILWRILEYYRFGRVVATIRGLRYGFAHAEWERIRKETLRQAGQSSE